MKKLLKIVLWIFLPLAFVFAVFLAVVGYDVIKLKSSAADIETMHDYLTEICFRQPGQQDACRHEIINVYLQCFSPFMSEKRRSACFQQAATTVNQGFRPELAKPNKNSEQITAWAAKAASDTLSFGYDDYEDKLDHARHYFASKGWVSFSDALKDANIVEAAKARKLHVQLKVLGKPEIKNAMVKLGIYTWFLEFPVEIDFVGATPPQPIHCVLVLQVQRVSSYESPDGIGIVQWITVAGS